MTTLQTALVGAATITTAINPPAMGTINPYNASGGPLSLTLLPLAGLNVGASFIAKKVIADGTLNLVTFTANGVDTFDDLSTSVFLMQPGEELTLQVVAISGVKYWSVINRSFQRTGLTAITTTGTLTNSTTATNIVSLTLPPAVLYAGDSFRIRVKGTIATVATSGTFTLTPVIQGTAMTQTFQMPSETSANATSPFTFETDITVRSTGTSGTAISTGYGILNLATTGVVYLTSTTTTTTTINTTSAASSNVLALQAQWGAANASNILTTVTGTIERVV